MTKDEALKLALEALENQRIFTHRPDHKGKELTPKQVLDAITAIKQARSAPVQDVDWKDMYEKEKRRSEMWVAKYEKDIGPLECAVPVAAPVQEPVVFYRCNGCGHAYEQVHPTSCDCMEAGGFERVEYYTTPPAQPAPVREDWGPGPHEYHSLPAPVQEPTCKQSLQVWVISNGKGAGQFSWDSQDERFWTRMEPAAQPAPVQEPVADFDDAQVQTVYNILCDADEGKPREEHWEGWKARRIVAALTTPPAAQQRIDRLEAELMRMQGRELKLQMSLNTPAPAAPEKGQP
jgi:hypothetical protein